MSKLANFYNERVHTANEEDFLYQVGHTERGKAVSPEQFEAMISEIRRLLQLREDDNLLDLCSGNGIVTSRLADTARTVVGVDFSSALVGVAKKHHAKSNLRFHTHDVTALDRLFPTDSSKFSKVLMHAALQHFSPDQLAPLLDSVLRHTTGDALILFSSVTDKDRRHVYFNTPKKKLSNLARRLMRTDWIGTWWDKKLITQICTEMRFECTFHPIDDRLDVSRHRFNLLLHRQDLTL